jgi:hypothetical protein
LNRALSTGWVFEHKLFHHGGEKSKRLRSRDLNAIGANYSPLPQEFASHGELIGANNRRSNEPSLWQESGCVT